MTRSNIAQRGGAGTPDLEAIPDQCRMPNVGAKRRSAEGGPIAAGRALELPGRSTGHRGWPCPSGRNPAPVGQACGAPPRTPPGGRHQRCSLVTVRLLRRGSTAGLDRPSLTVLLSNHARTPNGGSVCAGTAGRHGGHIDVGTLPILGAGFLALVGRSRAINCLRPASPGGTDAF